MTDEKTITHTLHNPIITYAWHGGQSGVVEIIRLRKPKVKDMADFQHPPTQNNFIDLICRCSGLDKKLVLEMDLIDYAFLSEKLNELMRMPRGK